jgi:hypothetical protein
MFAGVNCLTDSPEYRNISLLDFGFPRVWWRWMDADLMGAVATQRRTDMQEICTVAARPFRGGERTQLSR